MWTNGCLVLILGMALAGCASEVAPKKAHPGVSAVPAAEPPEETMEKLDPVKKGLKPGVLQDGVYSIVYPRKDLVVTNDMGQIPAAAGLGAEFHFFMCPCGKTQVIGQFCATEDEVNNVIDELRSGDMFISSVSNMLLNVRPRVMSIRFQGEGAGDVLAARLKKTLKWAGGVTD